jgi:pimeloyl-ACP methyl ester carboxylesterase
MERIAYGFALIFTATAAMALEDKYFDSAGVNIRYVEQGAGEPVILLHGFTSNIERAWIDRGIFAELAKTNRVIAFDSRGHGKSGKPHDPAQYGREMGQDVIRLMDYLGRRPTSWATRWARRLLPSR